MSWVETTYEKAMSAFFFEKLTESEAKALYTDYTSIRDAMYDDNFFGEIKGREPNLSDHSEKHIKDVFERSYKVIGEDEFKNFSVYEIYCLAIMILFHDVGNIFGRTGHSSVEKIAEVYNKYRINPQNYRDERWAITTGASAHSGISKTGSNDTLKHIGDTSIKGGNKINLVELASILRFSDELAEGKQRTCSFLIEKNLYDKKSMIYQKYASITSIEIDRSLERISVTYHIDIPKKFTQKAQKDFKGLMLFTYRRAVKLDIERRYAKSYSTVLKQFKYVTVQYNFSIDEIPIDMDLSKVTFEDLYPIPGNGDGSNEKNAKEIFIEKNSEFDLSKMIKNINLLINK